MVSKSSSGTFSTLGSNIGSETKMLSVDNLPSHNHTFTGSSHTHSVGAHSHGLNSHTHTYSKSSTTSGGPSNNTSGSTTLTVNQIPSHTHAHRIVKQNWSQISGKDALAALPRGVTNDGNNQGWSNYISGNDCANQSTGGGQGHTHTLSSHTHSITLSSTNTGAASGSTANSTAFNTGGTTQGGTIGNTGKGTALSVVQNSKVCIRWHRIS